MKRAELARLAGYSVRNLSRIAREIPGAYSTPGGQIEYDAGNPKLARWIAESASRNAQMPRRLPVKTRSKASELRSMSEDVDAIAAFVDAVEECNGLLGKVRFGALGVDFDGPLTFEEWRSGLKIIKLFEDLPHGRFRLLWLYFDNGFPKVLRRFFEILESPMFGPLGNDLRADVAMSNLDQPVPATS